jgi:DNA-directed RNA polymerase specialized sigma24 family protein
MDEVEELKGQLDGLMEQRYNVKVTPTITGMPGGGQISDPVFQTVERIINDYDVKMTEAQEQINELMKEHYEISMALWTLDVKQRKIVEMRCFEDRRWKEIERATHFSRTQCHRIFVKSVNQMQKYFSDQEDDKTRRGE